MGTLAAAIGAILANLGLVFCVVALIVAAARVRGARTRGERASIADIYWQELLFYGLGLNFIWYGIVHAFFQSLASHDIGWAASPFEYELGFAEIGIGIVALLSRWRGYDMRLAVTIIFSVFSFGAAAQHIYYIVCCGNTNPGNAGVVLWFNDIALPLMLLWLAWRTARETTA